MKIVLFGATGGTGGAVLTEGLKRGHEIVAVVRTPARLAVRHPNLTVVQGDILEPGTWAGRIQGAGSVISAVGIGTAKGATTVYSQGVARILEAMAAVGASRLQVVSAAPAAPRAEWTKEGVLLSRIVFPILHGFYGASYEDMARMETLLRAGSADWTAYRVPRLHDRPATGTYRLGIDAPVPRGSGITRADLGSAILDGIGDDRLFGRAVHLAN